MRLSAIGNAGGPSILGNTSNAASNLVLAGGTLNYVGSANSGTDRLFTIGGAAGTVANEGTGAVHFSNSGAIAYDHGGEVTFELRGTNNNSGNVFDPLIADNGAFKTSFKKGGNAGTAGSGGYWKLGNENNSYTGSTFINSGILEVTKLSNGGSNSSIGASSNAAENLKFFRGGLKYTGTGDSTNRLFTISGYGAAYEVNRIDSSGTGALKFTNTGAIGLTTNAGGSTGAIGTGGHLVLGGTYEGDNTLAAAIGGSSTTSSRLTKDGSGKWILTGNSSYKGITEILGGTLGVSNLKDGGINNNIGSSTNAADRLLINGGALQYTGAAQSTDRRFTVGTNGATLDASGTGALIFSNSAAVTYATNNVARTLTLTGSNTGDNTLAAAIGNAGTGVTSLVKSGTGLWVLSGNNTYSGTTDILGGILVLSHASALGTSVVNVAGGTLRLESSITINNIITIADGGSVESEVASGSTYTLGSSGAVTSASETTTAAIVSSQAASSGGTLSYAFHDNPTQGFAINDNIRRSEVLSLEGTGDDVFVLQMTLDAELLSDNLFLAWYDGVSQSWVNAVEGNSGIGSAVLLDPTLQGWSGAFNVAEWGSPENIAGYLGAWGYDSGTGAVWAVIDHNSDFTVVPEPGSLILLGLGLIVVIKGILRRRPASGACRMNGARVS